MIDAADRVEVERAESSRQGRQLNLCVGGSHSLPRASISLGEPCRGPHDEDRQTGMEERRAVRRGLFGCEEQADERDCGAGRSHDDRFVAAWEREAQHDREHVRNGIERAEGRAEVGDEEDG